MPRKECLGSFGIVWDALGCFRILGMARIAMMFGVANLPTGKVRRRTFRVFV